MEYRQGTAMHEIYSQLQTFIKDAKLITASYKRVNINVKLIVNKIIDSLASLIFSLNTNANILFTPNCLIAVPLLINFSKFFQPPTLTSTPLLTSFCAKIFQKRSRNRYFEQIFLSVSNIVCCLHSHNHRRLI